MRLGIRGNQTGAAGRHNHMPQTPTPVSAESLRVIVVELDDVILRRRAELPNLYVGLTIVKPVSRRVKQLQSGVDRVRWVRGHVVKLRSDLMVDAEFDSQDSARAAKEITQKLLQAQGYTVNRGKSMWSTYVIQLDEGAIDDPGSGWVYVGETSLSPEDRLAQHLSGARNRRGRLYSKVVRDHGQHLRYDLTEGLPVQYSSEASKRAEAELAERLRENGYRVEGGH